jgi:hypothetical protein
MIVATHTQEEIIMKIHIQEVIASERIMDVMHSIELFIVAAFFASLVGLACFAVL